MLASKTADDIKAEHYRIGNYILRFANQYGLLGLFWHWIFSIKEWPEATQEVGNIETIVRLADHIPTLSSKFPRTDEIFRKGFSVKYDEYAKWFFPRGQAPYPNLRKLKRKDRVIFWKDYAEPVAFWGMETGDVLYKFNAWQDFSSRKVSPEEEWKPGCSWGEMFKAMGVWGVGLHLNYNYDQKVWQQAYSFKSLLDAIKIMLINNIVENKNTVRLCKSCNKRVFIDTSGRRNLCNICMNSSTDRVKKLRTKEKAKKLRQEGKSIEDIANILRVEIQVIKQLLKEEAQS